jgi:deoxyribose-phosphate aldolase
VRRQKVEERTIVELRKKVEDVLGVEIAPRERFTEEVIPEKEEHLKLFLARHIDLTLVGPTSTRKDVERICREAREFGFFSVVVNPCYVALCSELLGGSGVVVGATVGFPFGQSKPEIKAREARLAFQEGAKEVDMVINIGALREGDLRFVYQDIRGVVEEMSPGVVKVVLETSYLSEEEKVLGCLVAWAARAHFVKNSTGFGLSGATPQDIQLLRRVVGRSLGVKAAGGIKNRDQAILMLKSGANRLGTSSGVAIVRNE